jgi:ribulose-phosphate 3-epimerase
MSARVSASILDCDWLRLGDELAAVTRAGADAIHLDVMDGHFVPNLSFGVPLARAVRSAATIPIHAHLMVLEPEWLVEKFTPFADLITIHLEATEMFDSCCETVCGAGRALGISLNPNTMIEQVYDILPRVSEVLVMSVFPGYGGQAFMPESLERIARLRDRIDREKLDCVIGVDGGVNPANARSIADAGADWLIAGSAIFKSPDYAAAVRQLKDGDR